MRLLTMGIISDIINNIKAFLKDLRRHLGILIIIFLIWILLLIGFFFLKVYLGPLQPDANFVLFLTGLGIPMSIIDLLTGMVQIFIAAIYILMWLYLWHRLIRMYFWRTAMKYNPPLNNESNESE